MLASAVAIAGLAGGLLFAGSAAPVPPAAPRPAGKVALARGNDVAPMEDGQTLRYLAVGGGTVPESTEVSLEQNLLLARSVLPGPGDVLFAGGRGSLSVRELRGDSAAGPASLRVRLGDIFQPRPGRRSRYRSSALGAAAATLERVESSLERALSRGREPLLFYVTSHGERGEHPADNYVALWGGQGLTVRRLAELHERNPRPLRAVVTSCFSGGFAELAFAGADATRGVTRAPRCGLFAGLADRETSGCDPNPDRRQQQGYSLHFLHALAGADRAGKPLADVDLDGDGRVSLLEAHTRARVASRSIDVPTTTSERFLRERQSEPRPWEPAMGPPLGLREELSVVQGLGAALDLPDADAVLSRWEVLDAELQRLDARLSDAEQESDVRYQAFAAELLGRWPVLDDPYHPQFEATLAANHADITKALADGPGARAFHSAEQAAAALDDAYHDVLVRESVVLRLLRAHDTLGLAAALEARGGPDLEHFRQLIECERHVPSP